MVWEDRFGIQLFSRAVGTGEIWLAVAYLASMFAVAAFRPQQIVNAFAFRLSFILFIIYLIVPSVVESALLALTADFFDFRPRNNPGNSTTVIYSMSAMLAKVMFGLSIYCGLSSLLGKRRQEPRLPEE